MAKQKAQPEKAARREAKYPYSGLTLSLKLGEAVKDHGGDRAEVPKSVVAKQLQMGEGSSAFGQLVASAKIFGIVDGVRTLRLTDLGRDYFFPTTETAERVAKLKFLGMPSAFRFLIDRFDGNRLPSVGILSNLVRGECHVPESWTSRVPTMFLSAATEAEVIDGAGYLRYAAALHSAGSPLQAATATDDTIPTPVTVAATPAMPQLKMAAAAGHSSPPRPEHRTWTYEDGSDLIRVETPAVLTMEQWDLLSAYVTARKPKTANGGPT